MNLRALRCFVAMADATSLTRATEASAIVQPAHTLAPFKDEG